MNKRLKALFVALACVTGLTSCGGSSDPFEGKVCLIENDVKAYILGERPISDFTNSNGDKAKSVGFKDVGGATSIEVTCGNDKVTLNPTEDKGITNLLINTKYDYTIKFEDSKKDKKGSFTTQGVAPRYINVEGINNARDIGGWKCKGGSIAQGLIYRGSEMNNHYNITSSGINTMNNVLKIKTDLDLRSASENGGITASPLGANVNYVALPTFSGYTGVTASNQVDNYKAVFKLLANPDSYPIYLHCYQGADRTGTIAAMIEGLLGVSDEDRLKDYNLTSFSSGVDCYRDGESSNFKYHFIQKNIEMIYKGESFEESMYKYVTERLGLTDAEVTIIKGILLGKQVVENGEIGEKSMFSSINL